jgi:hypothetical protein
LFALIAAARAGVADARLLRPAERGHDGLRFEKMNSPAVMTPWEMRCHLSFLAEQVQPDPLLAPVLARLEQFVDSWATAWAEFGTDETGRPTYMRLLDQVRQDLATLGGGRITLRNDWPLYGMLEPLIFQMALAPPAPAGSVTTRLGGYSRAAGG